MFILKSAYETYKKENFLVKQLLIITTIKMKYVKKNGDNFQRSLKDIYYFHFNKTNKNYKCIKFYRIKKYIIL